jgi:membrane carboxypeptidase/penicillin-binding protein PbpC
MKNLPKHGQVVRRFKNTLISLNYDLFDISGRMSIDDNREEYNAFEYFVMTLEDRRFLKHGGCDYKSLIREFVKAITFRKHGGASTIDMQMVRTITGFRDLTAYRKFYEILLSVLINFKYTKRQILRCYLRNAFFGSNIYGYEQASRKAFNKTFVHLSYHEKSMLAAMLLRPRPTKETERWKSLVISRAFYAQQMRFSVKQCED